MNSVDFPRASRLNANQLLTITPLDDADKTNPVIDRICWIDYIDEEICLFRVTDDRALPRLEPLDNIEAKLQSGHLSILLNDPWMPPNLLCGAKEREELPKRIRTKISRAENDYQKIEELVTKHRRELCIGESRSALLNQQTTKQSISLPTLYSHIRSYYRHGMTVNSMIKTKYANCGGVGIRKKINIEKKEGKELEIKRGRPYKKDNQPGESNGINIHPKTAATLAQAWDQFVVKEKLSVKAAHYKLLERHYSSGYYFKFGILTPKFLPKDQCPSQAQFSYWGQIEKQIIVAALRDGLKNYHLEHRELGGSARAGITGPGAQLQIDATGGLVHLVARDNRKKRIKKAIVYASICTYSQYVPGWSLALENASYAVLMTVLERAFSGMVDVYRKMGIDVSEEELCAGMIYDEILGDGGAEVTGNQSGAAAAALHFEWATTASGRADWKPYIERLHGEFKDQNEDLDGATRKRPNRGEKDPKDDACLTFDEMEKIIALDFLRFNHTYVVKNHPDEIHLAAEGLAPTPFNFYTWGIANRSGAGRSFDKQYIRAALLPKEEVSATREGLRFRGRIFYGSALLSQEGVFLRVDQFKTRRYRIAFDPRDLSEVWLVDEKGRLLEKCPLQPKSSHYAGKSLWEIEGTLQSNALLKASASQTAAEVAAGVDSMKAEILENARRAAKAAGNAKPEFCDETRRQEQAQRRSETTWIERTPDPQPISIPDSDDSVDRPEYF